MPKTCVMRPKSQLPVRRAQKEKRVTLLERKLLNHLHELTSYTRDICNDEGNLSTIPMVLFDYVSILGTRSCIVLSAQNAHRAYGVPASFLIADYLMAEGYCPDPPKLKKGEGHPEEQLLLKEARYLASNSKFALALVMAANPIAYTRRLHELGYCDDQRFCDIANKIADYGLADCDQRYADWPDLVTVEGGAILLGEPTEKMATLAESQSSIRSADRRVHFCELRRFYFIQQRDHDFEARIARPVTLERPATANGTTVATAAGNKLLVLRVGSENRECLGTRIDEVFTIDLIG